MHNLPSEVLDLDVIARLLNYERATTDPKFRHKKLVEVTSSSFQQVSFRDPRATSWWTHRLGPKLGLVFRTEQATSVTQDRDEPDLPSNLLPTSTPIPPMLQHATAHQLETWFWQSRGHDASSFSMGAFQHFFDLYEPNHPVRVRTETGIDYVTKVSHRSILEWNLIRPHLLTVSFNADTGTVHTTGQTETMPHSVLVFSDENGERRVVVDLASMQFGDVGRGMKGRSTFIVEPLDVYVDRLRTFAEDKSDEKLSFRITDHPDREVDRRMKNIAKRVKERWDRRESDHYCEQCGAPGKELKQCSKCKLGKRTGGYYCNEEHQKAAWRLHKKACS